MAETGGGARRTMMISTHGYVAAQPPLGRPDTGGQVVYVLEMSRWLARVGAPVDIYTRQFEDQPAIEPVNDRVRIVRIPCGGREFLPKETLVDALPEWIEAARAYIDAEGLEYDWINSHYWDAGVAGAALAQSLKIPHVHTPHSIGAWKRDNMDGDPAELEAQYNFAQRIATERTLYHGCNSVLATTSEQEDLLRSEEYAVPAQQIQVLPPGCDPRRFRPASDAERARAKKRIGIDGPFVLALGRLAENKGYDLLLKAMPTVFARHDDARLVLAVGSTHENDHQRTLRQQLEQLARDLGCEDRVVFRSYVPDEELPTYYHAADVFALSSRYEPFGMTAIEAMACGTPTVITTEGGLWRQVTWGVDCLCADPFDPEAFGHALHQALRYRALREQLSTHGAQRARDDFSWHGIARGLHELAAALPVTTTPSSTAWIAQGS